MQPIPANGPPMTDGAAITEKVRRAGLRPTRQRVALAGLLFGGGNRHVDAESLAREARDGGIAVSLATVYNTLNRFAEAGLLRRVDIEPGRSRFDTNLEPHHHIYDTGTGRLTDFEAVAVDTAALPPLPPGKSVVGIDIVVRIR